MARGKAVVAAEDRAAEDRAAVARAAVARAAAAGAVVRAEEAAAAAANKTAHAPQVVCQLSITDHQLSITNRGRLSGEV